MWPKQCQNDVKNVDNFDYEICSCINFFNFDIWDKQNLVIGRMIVTLWLASVFNYMADAISLPKEIWNGSLWRVEI